MLFLTRFENIAFALLCLLTVQASTNHELCAAVCNPAMPECPVSKTPGGGPGCWGCCM